MGIEIIDPDLAAGVVEMHPHAVGVAAVALVEITCAVEHDLRHVDEVPAALPKPPKRASNLSARLPPCMRK